MDAPGVFERVCERHGWACQENAAEYILPGNRRQLVLVSRFEFGGEKMLRFHSVIGERELLTETRMEAALKINFQLAHGALALHEDDLVVTDTFLLREADEDEVASSIRYLAETADRYERLIYGTDEH